ncbi:MAG: neutral/alkaline ceramidase [Oligoflexia bacterium]|nr:neutral/alkaline ceramidase [Oligoflexia bacterium]
MRKFAFRALLIGTLAFSFSGYAASLPESGPEYRIGAAREDITGPAAEVGMMGYATPGQKSRGIQTRLYSRAFVMESLDRARRVAFVSTDLAFVTQAVKLEVVKRLATLLPGLYRDENVMLTATHTHAGPGGFSHYLLFNITIGGFNGQSFEVIVSGIVRSIVRAHQSAEPGRLLLATGELEDATVNRSVEPYLANPGARRGAEETPRQMTVLKAVSESGRELGMVNWFAIHGTAASHDNRYISSDNKGHAAWLFERERGAGFVAAFANSEEGDVAPNLYDPHWNRLHDDFTSVRLSGESQFRKARELFEGASRSVGEELDYRHRWVRMPGLVVRGEFTGEGPRALCLAGLGYSFAAGAEDGPSGMPGFREGMRQGEVTRISDPLSLLYGIASLVLAPPNREDTACQYPKPVLVATGRQRPAWTPEVLPFQLFRLGSLALIAVPGEMTTFAGRTLRSQVLEQLSPLGVSQVVIAGLANTYSDYITTREEYQLQHYEGASTLYGPFTHAAYRQVFGELAEAMREGAPAAPGTVPPDLSGKVPEAQLPVLFDSKRPGEKYGQTLREPEVRYVRGQTVEAIYRTGHPNNDLRTGGTFGEVQVLGPEGWRTVATDADPELLFKWKRVSRLDCPACSEAVLRWRIPEEAPAGTYRILHHGARRAFPPGKVSSFDGSTREFEVR